MVLDGQILFVHDSTASLVIVLDKVCLVTEVTLNEATNLFTVL